MGEPSGGSPGSGRRIPPGVLHASREGADPDAPSTTQRVEEVAQHLIPVLTGVLIVLGAKQGDLQRPAEALGERVKRVLGR